MAIGSAFAMGHALVTGRSGLRPPCHEFAHGTNGDSLAAGFLGRAIAGLPTILAQAATYPGLARPPRGSISDPDPCSDLGAGFCRPPLLYKYYLLLAAIVQEAEFLI